MSESVLEVRNVSKAFPGVQALDQVSFEVRPNEIVGLVGENGAGKSTLLKILIGAYQPDEGEMLVGGQSVRPRSVKEASEYGLAMVFQEQSLLSNLTVRENIFLGNEEPFIRFGVINWGEDGSGGPEAARKSRARPRSQHLYGYSEFRHPPDGRARAA